MRKKALLAGLLVILILAIISYFHGWLVVVTFFFILMALVQLGYHLYAFNRLKKPSGEDDARMLLLIKIPIIAKNRPLQKIKLLLFFMLTMIDNAVCWPTGYYFYFRNGMEGARMDMPTIAGTMQRPQQLFKSVYYLAICLLLGSLYYFQLLHGGYIRVAAIVLLVGLLSFLIAFLAGPQSIAETFKRSPQNIYKAVFLMSLCISLSLLICFMILVSFYTYGSFHFESVHVVLSEFFKHESSGLLWNRKFHEIRSLNLIIDLSGLVFAATVLATVKSYSQNFKRSNEDIMVIVGSYLFRKGYPSALKWLNKIPRQGWDHNAWSVYRVAQAGLGNLEKVLSSFKQLSIDDGETKHITDHKYWETVGSLRLYNIDAVIMTSLMNKWIRECQCEGFFLILIIDECYLDENSPVLGSARQLFLDEPQWKEKFPIVNFILFNTGEGRAGIHETLYSIRDESFDPQYDEFTVSIVEFNILFTCLKAGEEETVVDDKLDKFSTRIESVKSPRDIYVLALLTSVLLALLDRKLPYYKHLVAIYDRMKEIMVDGDCQYLADQLKIFRQEEE